MLLLKKIFSATEVASELMEYILLLKTQSRVFCKTKHKTALVSILRWQSDYHGTMTTNRSAPLYHLCTRLLWTTKTLRWWTLSFGMRWDIWQEVCLFYTAFPFSLSVCFLPEVRLAFWSGPCMPCCALMCPLNLLLSAVCSPPHTLHGTNKSREAKTSRPDFMEAQTTRFWNIAHLQKSISPRSSC